MAVINYKAVRHSLKSLATQVGSALVGFIQAGAGAAPRTLQSKARDIVSVLDFIPIAEHAAILAGTSTYDCTAGIAAAFAAHDNVDFGYEGWLFNITSFNVAAGKSLVTRGRGPTFQQFPVTGFQRAIVVTGSNVTIGNCKGIGNIATDTDEQNHFIFIQANATYPTIENILIGDIHGQDIRGDVVYFGQSSSAYSLKNVHIGHVTFDNVYRNGVSCVSCDGFSVKSVTGTRCGLIHMDIEANVGSGPCVNGRVGYIHGRMFGLVSQAAADYIDNVEVGLLDLSPDHAAQSSPSNAGGLAIEDGLLLRNVKRARIGHLKADGFNRCAIFTTYTGGELGCELLEIGSLYMRDCSLTDAVYGAYVQGSDVTRLVVGHVDVAITQTSKRAFSQISGSTIHSALADIQASSSFLYDSDDCNLTNHEQSGANGFMLQACNRVSVNGGSFTGDRLATTSTKCSFINFTATASAFLFSSGSEDHFIANSTLNSVFYGFGTGIRSHLFPLNFGAAYKEWRDTNGKKRYKGSDPSSDTDGYLDGRVGQVTADAGDAAAALTVSSNTTTIWNTPITADRAVSLSTTGAINGVRLRIVRTAAATGAFNLNVGTGPLKALAAGQWCEVEYNGSAWVLTAFGSL